MYMYVDQVGGSGGAWTWLTSLAPFAVALLALGGVVWSSLHSSSTTLKAEDKRARTAIDAEDARARAAIAAEDRRHEHQIEHDDRRWRRDTRAEAYFGVIRAATNAVDAADHMGWFLRDVAKPGQGYKPASRDAADEQLGQWNAARESSASLHPIVRAIGSAEIANLSHRVSRYTSQALDEVVEASDRATRGEEPFLWKSVAKTSLRKARKARKALIRAVRAELGADGGAARLATANPGEPEHDSDENG
ncbi:hypothetical protein [Cellulomonas hominis]|uniref:hypothetical protein n=1 Tax=Cellulomonas hominis TaxID=156981 RepID=UPI001BCDF646|nr:hypothetical protein [Cellulomonas hominis]